MNILVIGGTRYFGVPMVESLLANGNEVTIATRGLTKDNFGDSVHRLLLDLSEERSVRNALINKTYDIVIDKMGYSSNEVKWMLESLRCDRFIHMSTAGVYQLDRFDIGEEEFDGAQGNLCWCSRRELSYDDGKRNAERALSQIYPQQNWVSVRAPFVLGRNDYTRRLSFYVEHVLRQQPMFIDNADARFCVAECGELSDFLVFLTDCPYQGPINACADGLISVAEILRYTEEKTGMVARLLPAGDPAPYNGTKDNSLSTARARALGFTFADVHDWIYDLLDYTINEVKSQIAREQR